MHLVNESSFLFFSRAQCVSGVSVCMGNNKKVVDGADGQVTDARCLASPRSPFFAPNVTSHWPASIDHSRKAFFSLLYFFDFFPLLSICLSWELGGRISNSMQGKRINRRNILFTFCNYYAIDSKKLKIKLLSSQVTFVSINASWVSHYVILTKAK